MVNGTRRSIHCEPLPDPLNVIIIEGEAHTATRAISDTMAEHFFHKYEWDYRHDDSDDIGGCLRC